MCTTSGVMPIDRIKNLVLLQFRITIVVFVGVWNKMEATLLNQLIGLHTF